MTRQEIDELKLETKLGILKYDVDYAEKSYETMLGMGDFVANNLKYSYQTVVEELGEERARELLEEQGVTLEQINKICDKWEATLKLIECFKIMKNINL